MTSYASALEQLGFSGLESEIYIHLLRAEPSTGYQIAQALGKPRANVYQSLESLSRKGAVLSDVSGRRLFRAVDPTEFVRRLQEEFAHNAARAGKVLGKIKPPAEDDGVYQLRTRAQTMDRAHREISRATHVILLDVSPNILSALRDSLSDAIDRGVTVGAQLYGGQPIDGAVMYMNPRHKAQRKRWHGDWLNFVSDGRCVIWSFFKDGDETPFQALISSSPFLSWIYHSALAGEIMMSAMNEALRANVDGQELKRLLRQHERLAPTDAPGVQELAELIGS